MDLIDYKVSFYKNIDARIGPSSDETSARALKCIPYQGKNSRILEIGCGTGFQTLFLARNTKAKIVAIDIVYQFIQLLQNKIQELNLNDRIEVSLSSMDQIPYPDGFFDVIWTENSIYHMGFERGISEWRRYLKPGGYLAATDFAWLTDGRPEEVEEYLLSRVSSPGTLENRLAALKKHGYKTIAHFVMPEECWTENYYKPALAYVDEFLKKYNYNALAQRYVQILTNDIAIHGKYRGYYGVVFFVAQKVGRENAG
jgi:ubiquinone/menaquinone biosynthesis C-methylase UbiE